MDMNKWLAVAIALLLIVLVFTVQNAETVNIKFLFWTLAAPRAVVIVLAFLFGVIAGWSLRIVLRRVRGQSHKMP